MTRLPYLATPGAALALAAILAPGSAAAHATERMVILTLPTGYGIAGAAAAVALTALLGALAPRLPAPQPRVLRERRRAPRRDGGWLATLVFWSLVAAGLFGSRDPLGNPLPLAVWVGLWVALPLVTIVFGDVWRMVEPWRAPVRMARRALGRTGGAGLSRLGAWPAVAGLLAFAWFETVSLAPADPAGLARVAAGYWTLVFVLAVLEGEDWLRRGETFGVYFGLLARLAPLWRETAGDRERLMLGPPGSRILAMPGLPPGAMAFVALVLAAVSFDGLSETFWWLARIGVNPLEFPGRSAVTGVNTAGLLAAWALTAATILGAIALGSRLAGRPSGLGPTAGVWMLSFLPIAAGYHVAHYLVALLTTGQYAVAWLNDPLGRGWRLLGLPPDWVSFGFLADPHRVAAVWAVQLALIVGAHVLAVLLALHLAARDGPVRPAAHLPMTLLMVAYTAFGLWLLSTATGT